MKKRFEIETGKDGSVYFTVWVGDKAECVYIFDNAKQFVKFLKKEGYV